MSSETSITEWLNDLKLDGDEEAARRLWERYFGRLVAASRKILQGTSRAAADEEDVVLSAFHSFCRGVAENRFPRLNDRDDLWKILVTIAFRKALKVVNRENRTGFTISQYLEAQLVSGEPSPVLAAMVKEEFYQLFSGIRTEELRQIALHKMEGHTIEEISILLNRSESFVERKLKLIRELWSHKLSTVD